MEINKRQQGDLD